MKVSIIMAVKNEEKHIKESIESILNQSVSGLELIVIDDNSSDSTCELIKLLALRDKRIVFERNPSSGKVSAFKHGYKLSSGQFVALFAGDDIMPVDSLSERLGVVTSMKSPAILISKIRVLSDDEKINGLLIPKKKGVGNPSGASIMFDRAAAKYLMDIPDMLPNEDTWMDFCITYLHFLHVQHDDGVACLWRVHSGNSITIKDNFEVFNQKFTKRMDVISKFKNKYNLILTKENVNYLSLLGVAENKRQRGKWLSILLSEIRLSDKLRFLFYSNQFFYSIRQTIRKI